MLPPLLGSVSEGMRAPVGSVRISKEYDFLVFASTSVEVLFLNFLTVGTRHYLLRQSVLVQQAGGGIPLQVLY